MRILVEPVGRFGRLLHQAIEAKETTLQAVAAKTEVTYEHIRKLIREVSFPSKPQVEKLSRVLGFDFDKAWEAVAVDRMQRKLGPKMLATVLGKNHELGVIEAEWPYLTDWQKEALNTMAKNFGREARAARQPEYAGEGI